MEDIAVIILGIIISLVASARKNAQKEAAKAKKPVLSAPVQKAAPPTLDTAWEVPRMETVVPAAPTIGTEGTDACHDYMLPASTPVPAAVPMENLHVPAAAIGADGVDACHEYMLKEALGTPAAQPAETGLTPEEARELMRGIILSEIMARPQQRFVGRRR